MSKENLQRIYLNQRTYEEYTEHLYRMEKAGNKIVRTDWHNIIDSTKGEYFIIFEPAIYQPDKSENDKKALMNLFDKQDDKIVDIEYHDISEQTITPIKSSEEVLFEEVTAR